jgi:poly(A) RNA polymerase, mitochondrial
MSELLYLMGEIDNRVRPLVCAVRRWAIAVGLTNPTPGRWISNFSLTLLTLFYLQKQDVLPSLGTLIALAGKLMLTPCHVLIITVIKKLKNLNIFVLGPNDTRLTAEGINCTFLRDLSGLALSKNEDSLENLLFGFFEFYSNFDFGTKGLSLVAGKEIVKPDHSPLYIENPLERYLNVSKNLSPEETTRLKVELRNAAWMMEDKAEVREGVAWGLLKLIATKKGFKSAQAKTFRLVQVKDLFIEEDVSHPQPILRDIVKHKNKRR